MNYLFIMFKFSCCSLGAIEFTRFLHSYRWLTLTFDPLTFSVSSLISVMWT